MNNKKITTKRRKPSAVKVNRKRPRKSLTLSPESLKMLPKLVKYYMNESRTIDAALEALSKLHKIRA